MICHNLNLIYRIFLSIKTNIITLVIIAGGCWIFFLGVGEELLIVHPRFLCIWSYWLLAFRLFLRWLNTANAFPYKATCICFKPTYISVNQIISNYVRNPLIHIMYMHLKFSHNLDDIKIIRIVLEMLNMETTYIPVYNLWQ